MEAAERRLVLAVVAATLVAVLVAFALLRATVGGPAEEGAETSVPGVVFDTERPVYAVGDRVAFFVRNEGEEGIGVPNSAPWRILRDVDGAWLPVESHGAAQVFITLGPGKTLSWSWTAETQDEPGLAPVEEGLYRIDLTLWVGEEFVVVTTIFRLR
jgi:hypothetical protein